MKQFFGRNKFERFRAIELISYGIAAVFMAACISHVSHSNPVEFTRFISEDQWGEYATSVAFAFCALLSLSVVGMCANRWERAAWILIGAGAFFVAGEELSWGQRIFGIQTPKILLELNAQGELTVHNLYLFDSDTLRTLASLLIGCWLLVSLYLSFVPGRIQNRLRSIGFPSISIPLFPLFLLPVYYWRSAPVHRPDEVGEFFLGLSMAALALSYFLERRTSGELSELKAVGMTGALFVLIIAISVVLPQLSSHSRWSWPLNHTAAHTYPSNGMFNQSQEIFEYIYANPRYVQMDTRIRHGRMLLHADRPAQAKKVLERAVVDLEAKEPQNAQYWLHLGVAHALLGQVSNADTALDMAAKSYQAELESNPDDDNDTLKNWWDARISMVRGDTKAALAFAESARKKTSSLKLHTELDRWTACVVAVEFYEPWHYYHWIELLNRDL